MCLPSKALWAKVRLCQDNETSHYMAEWETGPCFHPQHSLGSRSGHRSTCVPTKRGNESLYGFFDGTHLSSRTVGSFILRPGLSSLGHEMEMGVCNRIVKNSLVIPPCTSPFFLFVA